MNETTQITSDCKEFNELSNVFSYIHSRLNNPVYVMNYSKSGVRWPDNYTRKLTTVHKYRVCMYLVDDKYPVLKYDREYNVHSYPEEIYFRYNGYIYYHQLPGVNEWHRQTPEIFHKLNDGGERIVNDIANAITYGRGCKTTKNMLLAFGDFFGCSDYFLAVALRKKIEKQYG